MRGLSLESLDLVRVEAADLLLESGLGGMLPTPIHDLAAAAGLTLATESALDRKYLASLAPDVGGPMLDQVKAEQILAIMLRKSGIIHLSDNVAGGHREPFTVAHEIGHARIEHHNLGGYGDTGFTVSPKVDQMFEREANQFASELLFQNDLLCHVASNMPASFDTIRDLHRQFGASIHSTFRRYIETHEKPLAGIVLGRSPLVIGDQKIYKRFEVLSSESWRREIGDVTSWPRMVTSRDFGFVGTLRVLFRDDAGGVVRVPANIGWADARYEAFDNNHKIMVLLEAQC